MHIVTLVYLFFWPGLQFVSFRVKAGLLMGDDIGSGLSSMAVCFDFRSTNVVQLSNSTGFNVITH